MIRAQTQITGLLTALMTTACVPTLELKEPRVFTGPMVKRMQFDDACGLQKYFDRKPPHILILEERAVSPDSRTELGRAKVLVRRGPQLKKLIELLNRYYREVPRWLGRSDVTVMTDFLRRIPRPGKKRGVLVGRRGVVVIPTTAHITVKSGQREAELAYHPCLGELLFGRRTYLLRRMVLAPMPRVRARPRPRPRPRTRPRATPRPDPRPDPRPRATPRPDPRPDPRPRATPRPDPRPDPRPRATPRPDPRRPSLPPLPR